MLLKDTQLLAVVVFVALLQLVCVYMYFGRSPVTEALQVESTLTKPKANAVEGDGKISLTPKEEPVDSKEKVKSASVKEIPQRPLEQGAYEAISQPVLKIGPSEHYGGAVFNVVDLRRHAAQMSSDAITLLTGGHLGPATTGNKSVRRLVSSSAEIQPVCLYNSLPSEPEAVAHVRNPHTQDEFDLVLYGTDATGYGVEIEAWGMAEPNKLKTGMKMIEFYRKRKQEVVYIDTGATLGFLSISFAQAGADVYAFEPLHHHAWRICQSILLNNLQDKVALFNVAPYNIEEEQAWCTPRSHLGLRYSEISCPQGMTDQWFYDYDYELFLLRDSEQLFQDTLGHVFNNLKDSKAIIIRVVFDYAEEFLSRVERLVEADLNVKHIWVSSNLSTWKRKDALQLVKEMRFKGFQLVDETCEVFLDSSKKEFNEVNEFLFTREPLACGLDTLVR